VPNTLFHLDQVLEECDEPEQKEENVNFRPPMKLKLFKSINSKETNE